MFSVIIVVLLIAFDQFTKYLATQYLEPVGSMPFIPGVMELRYVLNDGAAFGFFAGRTWLLIGFTGVALVALAIFAASRKNKTWLERVSYILIISGGVGNLIDRIVSGVVVDFFATTFINFAVFNVADCFVVVGTILLMLFVILDEMKMQKEKKADKTQTGERAGDNTDLLYEHDEIISDDDEKDDTDSDTFDMSFDSDDD